MNRPTACVQFLTWCWAWNYCYTSSDMTACCSDVTEIWAKIYGFTYNLHCWSDSVSLVPVQPLTLNTTCPPFPPSPPSGPAVSLDHSWRNEIAPSPPFPPIARTLRASTKCCGWNRHVPFYLLLYKVLCTFKPLVYTKMLGQISLMFSSHWHIEKSSINRCPEMSGFIV